MNLQVNLGDRFRVGETLIEIIAPSSNKNYWICQPVNKTERTDYYEINEGELLGFRSQEITAYRWGDAFDFFDSNALIISKVIGMSCRATKEPFQEYGDIVLSIPSPFIFYISRKVKEYGFCLRVNR